MLLAQLALRQLPASVVHDTVAAIARGIDYRRSLRQSFLDRLFLWLAEAISHLVRFLRHSPVSRPFGYTVLGLIVLGVAARLLIAAQARDDTRGPLRWRTSSRASSTDDNHASSPSARHNERCSSIRRRPAATTRASCARAARRRTGPSRFARRFDIAYSATAAVTPGSSAICAPSRCHCTTRARAA
jgi:hypothetical protein